MSDYYSRSLTIKTRTLPDPLIVEMRIQENIDVAVTHDGKYGLELLVGRDEHDKKEAESILNTAEQFLKQRGYL